MSKELVCPFCNKKLEPIGTSGQFQCGTWDCDASFNFIATRDVWKYIDRTRKALDCAINTLETVYGMSEDASNIESYVKCKRIEINRIIKGGDNE